MTRLYVTMGMPGSGKTHWSTTNAPTLGATLVSSDAVRTEGADPQRWFIKMHEHVDQLLDTGHDVIVDACNTTADQRRRWLKLGRTRQATCILVAIDTPARTAVRRNLKRPETERVPADRMHRYASQYATSKVVASRESWDETIVVGSSGETHEVVAPVVGSRTW